MRALDWATWGAVALAGIATPAPSSAESDSKTVQVSATILPRLELSIAPETGEGIAFGAIEQPPAGQEASRSIKVRLSAFSNLGRPYHITQLVRRPLTRDDGTAIPEDQFRFTTRDAARGSLGAPTAIPVAVGIPATLYTSDERGKSDAFFTDYTLVVTPHTPAGDFVTEIVYTVTGL